MNALSPGGACITHWTSNGRLKKSKAVSVKSLDAAAGVSTATTVASATTRESVETVVDSGTINDRGGVSSSSSGSGTSNGNNNATTTTTTSLAQKLGQGPVVLVEDRDVDDNDEDHNDTRIRLGGGGMKGSRGGKMGGSSTVMLSQMVPGLGDVGMLGSAFGRACWVKMVSQRFIVSVIHNPYFQCLLIHLVDIDQCTFNVPINACFLY